MRDWLSLLRAPGIRTFGRSFKDHTLLAVPLLLFASVVQVLSILAHHRHGGPFLSTMWSSILGHKQSFAFLLGGLIIGAALGALGLRGWRENSDHLWKPFKDLTFFALTVLVLVFMAAVWILSERVSDSTEGGSSGGLLHFIEKDPGGMFVAFMGILTVIGFAVTLQSLWEIRSTIKSFPDLNDRLCKMFDTTRDSETVHMVCYTPSLGYIALKKEEFDMFFDRITGSKKRRPRAEMICLRDQDLKSWHDLFVGRKTGRGDGIVTTEQAQKATDTAEKIVEELELKDTVAEQGKGDQDGRSPIKRLPFEFMPGYYFFFNSQRAIIVAPLNLPFPKGAPRTEQKGQKVPSGPTVHMIGFETSDQGIIHDLRELYDTYYLLPSVYLAEDKKSMSFSELKAWADDQNLQISVGVGKKLFDVGAKLFHQIVAVKNGGVAPYCDCLPDDNAEIEVIFRVHAK